EALESLAAVNIFPGKQFATPQEKINRAMLAIREELGGRIADFEKEGRLLEAQRIKMRTEFDLEQLQELGFCSGIENYSRHLAARPPGSRPGTLIDFFPRDFLLVVDESHATLPQVGGMHAGDMARKKVLVEHGFRLPSALDNRPLHFDEFRGLIHQAVYVSATPGALELGWAGSAHVAEQIVRPTGLVDPEVTLKPLGGQIDDLLEEIRRVAERKERTLVTTLTKRTAEELTDYLRDLGISVRYLHSEIDAIERVEILRALRKGDFDVLVGINLLREGLDLPEVSLVAILDADKEGYLRSTTSLIQTAGRAARHLNGRVILYADQKTQSIQKFLAVSEYRRARQLAYNREHGITPRSVRRAVEESLSSQPQGREAAAAVLHESVAQFDATETLRELEAEMIEAANQLQFEKAALLRDQIRELKSRLGGAEMRQPGATARARHDQATATATSRYGRRRGKTGGR
ncbi:MAG: helicase-related protein, partial [Verrucomicrobiota bacterium]